jgi:butyrate kinase
MVVTACKVLTINPGSTSTKIGLFAGDEALFIKTVEHDSDALKGFATTPEQIPYRLETIDAALDENGMELSGVDAFVGRGGGLWSMEGGVYEIDDVLLEHARTEANGVHHPASIGPQIARALAEKYSKPAFVVNPPDTDELQDLARMTGVKGIYRNVHLHALNLKETAIRHAATIGKTYEECNFVVCHLGGGISVSAHTHGNMIDGNDIVGGEGPMAPTRCGALPVTELIKLCFSGKEERELRSLCTRTGGFVSLVGTADAREVQARAEAGDVAAARAWNAMVYQIAKYIGEMAVVLRGDIDGILLGGGLVHSADLVQQLEGYCSWIAPVSACPGEFELEAMASAAIRVLGGVEQVKRYSGVPRFQGFAD